MNSNASDTKSSSTLLAIFAHPDDESFGSGGTLALHASEGRNVILVCATRGEVGEIADPGLATPETLPQVRESELRQAADALGIKDVHFLGYRDSGMDSTPENQDPRAFVQAPDENVTSELVGIIRKVKPQVILTFDPGGGYGHPDHVAISRHTLAAFHAAGDSNLYTEQGKPWQPSRLFYVVFTLGRLKELRDQMKSLGQDTSRYDERIAKGFGWPDDQAHAVLDVSNTVDAKWKALGSHRTQHGTFSLFSRVPESEAKKFLSREYFSLISPETAPGTRLSDLFDGL